MDIRDALADDVSLEQFFTTWVERLFESRREDFSRASEVPLILCFRFEDTDEVFTVELSDEGATVERDEMVDFPVLTFVGRAANWPAIRREARPIVEALERRRDEVVERVRITREQVEAFERFDLVIGVTVVGRPGDEPVTFDIISNDYTPPDDARRFDFTVELATLEAIAVGDLHPEQVARGLSIRGDVGAAANLGGFLLEQLG